MAVAQFYEKAKVDDLLADKATIDFVQTTISDGIMGTDVVFSQDTFTETTTPNNNINAGQFITFKPQALGMVQNETLKTISVRTRSNTGTAWTGNFVGVARIMDETGATILAESSVATASGFNQDVEFRFLQNVMLNATNTYMLVFSANADSPYGYIPMRLIVGETSADLYVNGNTGWRPVLSAYHFLSISGQMLSFVEALRNGDFSTTEGIAYVLTDQKNSVPSSASASSLNPSPRIDSFTPDEGIGDDSELLGDDSELLGD